MAYLLDVAYCYMAFAQGCQKIHGQKKKKKDTWASGCGRPELCLLAT